MELMLIRCPRCRRWSRAAAGDSRHARCPGCDEELPLPATEGGGASADAVPPRPRRRWKRLVLALLLAPAAGFAAGAANGDWRGVWKAVQARLESERLAQARFDEALAKGKAEESAGNLRAAIAAYAEAAALDGPSTPRRRRADEARDAAIAKRAEAHAARLKSADKAKAAHDYAAAEAVLVPAMAAFDPTDPEAVAATRAFEEVRSAAAKLPEFRALLAKGDELIRTKRYEPAIRAFAEAKALFPEEDAPEAAIRRAEAEREILASQLDERAGAAEAAGDLEKSVELLTRLVEDVGGARREDAGRRLLDARRALAGELVRNAREDLKRGNFGPAVRGFDRAIAAGLNTPEVLAEKRDAERGLALERCDSLLNSGRYADALEMATIADQSGAGDARTAIVAADARTAVDHAEIRRFRAGEGPVRGLAFRKGDGRLAVVTAAGLVQLWDVRNGRYDAPAWERKPAGPRVEATALSEDGRWAALATRASIELIDLDDPTPGPRLIPIPSAVSALAVAGGPDGGARLAAGDRQGSAWAWPKTARDARPVVLASPSSLPVTRVGLSISGDVAVGRDSGPVDLFRANGEAYPRRPLSDRNAAYLRRAVTCLVFSPDGTSLLAGRDAGSIASWSLDLDGRSLVDRPMEREVTDMAFSRDGRMFAAASEDRTILIGHNRKEAGVSVLRPTTFPGAHRDAVRALAFDDAVLATGGADGIVKLWSLERAKLAEAVGKPAP